MAARKSRCACPDARPWPPPQSQSLKRGSSGVNRFGLIVIVPLTKLKQNLVSAAQRQNKDVVTSTT